MDKRRLVSHSSISVAPQDDDDNSRLLDKETMEGLLQRISKLKQQSKLEKKEIDQTISRLHAEQRKMHPKQEDTLQTINNCFVDPGNKEHKRRRAKKINNKRQNTCQYMKVGLTE